TAGYWLRPFQGQRSGFHRLFGRTHSTIVDLPCSIRMTSVSTTPVYRVTFWRTLRFRLAVWNALIVALTAGITLAGLRQGVKWTLLHELDQILTEDFEEVELAVRETATGDL